MAEKQDAYEQAKRDIYLKKMTEREHRELFPDEYDDRDGGELVNGGGRVGLSDILQVGSKVVIGGGLGLLGGIAVVAVAAGAGELVIAGAATKIAGAVGGALGLSKGIDELELKKRRKGA